ncbi:MAG: hypothetical protein U0599_27495 [Vicinamibacteria bacterium]
MFLRSTVIRFQFPAREKMPPLQLTWWDGGLMPPRPPGFETGRRLGDDDGGILLLGDKGTIMAGCYGQSPRLVPESAMQKYSGRRRRSPASPTARTATSRTGSTRSRRARRRARTSTTSRPAHRDGAAGNLAVRFLDKQLLWNGEKMEITNDADANAYVHRAYRDGFTLGV